MDNATARVPHAETFREYGDVTSGVEFESARYFNAVSLGIKVIAAAAAMTANAANLSPTTGVHQSAASGDALFGDPPDFAGLFPTSWTNAILRYYAPSTDIGDASAIALQELRSLRTYESGWNGGRSRQANEASFDHAERFLRMLAVAYPRLEVDSTIFSNGSAALEIFGPSLEAVLEFHPDGSISATFDADRPYDLDVPGFGEAIPEELKALF